MSTRSIRHDHAASLSARLPVRLSADDLEELAQQISNEARSDVDIDWTFSERPRLLAFAEARMLGLLALLHRQAVPVQLTVRSRSGGSLPPRVADTIKVFAESVAALPFTAFENISIIDATGSDRRADVKRVQLDLLREGRGYLWTGREVTAAQVTGSDLHPVAAMLQQGDRLAFERELFQVIHQGLGLPVIDNELRISVANFTWEAFQNVREHAVTDVFDRIMPGMHFLAVHRSNLSDRNDAQKYQYGPISPTTEYVAAVHQALSRPYVSGTRGARRGPAFLVEITVADSGPGISARMARTLAIYGGTPKSEIRMFRRAIGKGTSKDGFARGAGLGIPNMLRAACRLNALVMFRTGRMLAYRDFSRREGQTHTDDFDGWSINQLSVLAGTAVSLLFPWVPGEALQLALDLGIQ